jgi:hypothetical protein
MWRGAELHVRQAMGPNQKLEVLADRLFVRQVVILLHQAVEQRLAIRAPHLFDLHRPGFV